MKCKRLKAYLTMILVLVLSVSFSVPVQAGTTSKVYVIDVKDRSSAAVFYGSAYPYAPSNGGAVETLIPATVVYDLNVTFDISYRSASVAFSFLSPVRSPSAVANGVPVSSALVSDYFAVGPAYAPVSVDRLIPFEDMGSIFLEPGSYSLYYVESCLYAPTSSSARSLSRHNFKITYNQGIRFSFSRMNIQDATGLDLATQTELLKQSTENQTKSLNQATKDQTDTLTNGYDNTGMNNDNDRLSASLNSFDDAEGQVTDQSVEYIDAVTFFDPTTHLQLMTAITFTSTFLQNLFVALGDWSVLVTIALSLAFALMLVGWFKYRK